jgi:Luciferase-like monooxygenase
VARRRPAKLAREVATLDRLTGGRTILGVGLGAPVDDEYASFGDTTDTRVLAERLDEGLHALGLLWSGEPVTYLSYGHVEELRAGRGIDVDHVTILRWVRHFPSSAGTARRLGGSSGGPGPPLAWCRQRSSLTGHPPIHAWSMSCRLRSGTTPSTMPTTASRPATRSSKAAALDARGQNSDRRTSTGWGTCARAEPARGHYEIGASESRGQQPNVAFTDLARAI